MAESRPSVPLSTGINRAREEEEEDKETEREREREISLILSSI